MRWGRYRFSTSDFGEASERSERRLEGDLVVEHGAAVDGREAVLVPERLERALALLVDEAVRVDPTR